MKHAWFLPILNMTEAEKGEAWWGGGEGIVERNVSHEAIRLFFLRAFLLIVEDARA